MPFAELQNNVTIHYKLAGKGVDAANVKVAAVRSAAAVMLACEKQGFDASTQEMSAVRSILLENMATLSFSYRGSGKSSVPASLDEYSVAAYREDTRLLAERVGLSQFGLVGYSHGGYFAADYALAYPAQVSGLVLVEPALFVDRAKLQERVRLTRDGNGDGAIQLLMSQMMPEMSPDSKEYINLVSAIKQNYPNPIGLAGEWYARSTHELGEAELSRIRVPTLVIGGAQSWVRENVARAAKLIPGAKFVLIDGTHNVWEEKPTEVAKAIESFLGGSTSSSTPKA